MRLACTDLRPRPTPAHTLRHAAWRVPAACLRVCLAHGPMGRPPPPAPTCLHTPRCWCNKQRDLACHEMGCALKPPINQSSSWSARPRAPRMRCLMFVMPRLGMGPPPPFPLRVPVTHGRMHVWDACVELALQEQGVTKSACLEKHPWARAQGLKKGADNLNMNEAVCQLRIQLLEFAPIGPP